MIGPKILSLAEVDAPPEDLVFHKFYVNKMKTFQSQIRQLKNCFDVDDDDEVVGDDESDNEEIDNMLDPADLSLVAENE